MTDYYFAEAIDARRRFNEEKARIIANLNEQGIALSKQVRLLKTELEALRLAATLALDELDTLLASEDLGEEELRVWADSKLPTVADRLRKAIKGEA